MKSITKIFMACGLLLGLAACNKEIASEQGNPGLADDAVYMQFSLDFPATKAVGDEATEVATDAESTVSGLQLVLINPDTKEVIAKSTPGYTPAGQNLYVAPFKSEQLAAYTGTHVNVLVYVNTTAKSADANLVNDVLESGVEAIWNPDHFWMTNADADYTQKFPSAAELAAATRPEKACPLGTISVERVAARFDLATDSVEFPVETTEAPVKEIMKIKLMDLALFNMNNQTYYQRRVSANGQNTVTPSDWTGLFGKEVASGLGANYVVDPHAADKTNTANLLYTAPEQLVWTKISDITETDNWTDKAVQKYDYRIWRYATENVIPQGVDQNTKYVTGVAFRGKLVPGANCETSLKNQIEAATEPIYIFNNKIYGTWDRVRRAAYGDFISGTSGDKFVADATLAGAYEGAQNLVGAGLPMTPEAAATVGFTTYPVSNLSDGTKGYYVYYNYYNRHTDNLKPKEPGVMEFAVVRNNVYKLQVSKITKYGLPEYIPEDRPVEQDEVYFQVMVRILPWNVKVNNIEL